MLHNTFTSNNKKHQFEVEIAPDVYLSPFAGGPGEVVKVLADIAESGLGQGTARYLSGKYSPILSAADTAISGVNYYGGKIWKGDSELAKDVHAFWEVASHLLPIPIGVTSAVNYATREQNQTPLGWGLSSTGLGRFSKPSTISNEAKMHEDVIHAYKTGNTEYVDRLIKKGDLSEEKAQDLQDESRKSDIERKMEHMRVEKAIDFYKGAHEKDKTEAKEILMEKYENFLDSKASPNEKARIGSLYKKVMKEEDK